MSAIDPKPYLAHYRELVRRGSEARAEAVARARAAVPLGVETLRARGARRIWLVGSLPRGTFAVASDLDFMTEGLGDAAARAAAQEAAESTGFWVDVLRAEDLDPKWRAYHERFGELVHG